MSLEKLNGAKQFLFPRQLQFLKKYVQSNSQNFPLQEIVGSDRKTF
jgi:hypothetical protein